MTAYICRRLIPTTAFLVLWIAFLYALGISCFPLYFLVIIASVIAVIGAIGCIDSSPERAIMRRVRDAQRLPH